MNRLKTQKEKDMELYKQRMEEYKKDSLDAKWFYIIIISGLLLTALIENL